MKTDANSSQTLPLAGIRVLELAHIVAGPSAGLMLADLGADVIKVEHPDIGDTARNQANQGAGFLSFNRNKRSVALNLREPKGKEVFERLVKTADIVLNNYVPGALDRLGLGYGWAKTVNPRIIYCSVKGFLPGPNWSRPLLDELAQMEGGLAYLTGTKGRPLRAGASITDIGAATYAVVGILAALNKRHATGEGEEIEAGLFETIVFWLSQHLAKAQISGEDPPPRGEGKSSGMGKMMGWAVYQLFNTADERQVFIAVTSDRHWQSLCDVLGFADWRDLPEFSSNKKRSARRAEIADRIQSIAETLSFETICQKLEAVNVPFAAVNTPMTLMHDHHLGEGNRWIAVEGAGQSVRVPKMPLHFGNMDFTLHRQPPALGEHSDDLLQELGYSTAEIEAMKQSRTVLKSSQMLNIDHKP